jgi:uncharacterized protein YjiS (DUF1127 family)
MLRNLAHSSATVEHRPEAPWRPSRHRSWRMRLGSAAARAVWFWTERSRQRRALAELDDRLLRDIGLTRDEARRECANPFWRP